jgi:hypothetical protein
VGRERQSRNSLSLIGRQKSFSTCGIGRVPLSPGTTDDQSGDRDADDPSAHLRGSTKMVGAEVFRSPSVQVLLALACRPADKKLGCLLCCETRLGDMRAVEYLVRKRILQVRNTAMSLQHPIGHAAPV